MGIIVAVIVALIGGFVQSGRHPDRLAVDVHMVWWMAVVAAGSVLGAGARIFDGAQTAEWIGYVRGDGGFQWQTAMSELVIGVLGTMAYWFRGYFWLATIVALTTQSVGDAAGHIYYTVVHSNSRPYNFGLLLCTCPAADRHVGAVRDVLAQKGRRGAEERDAAGGAGSPTRQHRARRAVLTGHES